MAKLNFAMVMKWQKTLLAPYSDTFRVSAPGEPWEESLSVRPAQL